MGLLIYSIEACPEINIIMAEAMTEGNAIHAWIVKQKLIPHPYLNTEEALQYGGKSLSILKEWVSPKLFFLIQRRTAKYIIVMYVI